MNRIHFKEFNTPCF